MRILYPLTCFLYQWYSLSDALRWCNALLLTQNARTYLNNEHLTNSYPWAVCVECRYYLVVLSCRIHLTQNFNKLIVPKISSANLYWLELYNPTVIHSLRYGSITQPKDLYSFSMRTLKTVLPLFDQPISFSVSGRKRDMCLHLTFRKLKRNSDNPIFGKSILWQVDNVQND